MNLSVEAISKFEFNDDTPLGSNLTVALTPALYLGGLYLLKKHVQQRKQPYDLSTVRFRPLNPSGFPLNLSFRSFFFDVASLFRFVYVFSL
jgi:hypothetical protein